MSSLCPCLHMLLWLVSILTCSLRRLAYSWRRLPYLGNSMSCGPVNRSWEMLACLVSLWPCLGILCPYLHILLPYLASLLMCPLRLISWSWRRLPYLGNSMSCGPVNRSWEHGGMSVEPVTMSWNPVSMSSHTLTIFSETLNVPIETYSMILKTFCHI
jgi:hypothetical protein